MNRLDFAGRTAVVTGGVQGVQLTEQHIQYMLSKTPMGDFVNVEEVAALACWLASEDCRFSTGGVFDSSGGRATN
jgi:3-oxoacyl-[acyl-carrier protein] reductase